MRDPTRFAGYVSPADLLQDNLLSPADKAAALQAWRHAVDEVKRVHARELHRHERFMEEIDRSLASLERRSVGR